MKPEIILSGIRPLVAFSVTIIPFEVFDHSFKSIIFTLFPVLALPAPRIDKKMGVFTCVSGDKVPLIATDMNRESA